MKYIHLLSALFGLLLPMAVRAQNVSNTGAYPQYASPYVFHENISADIGYAYDSNGSMTRNPNRHIGLLEYDSFNNPRLIQFTDGSVTEYVYDASGVKLKTLHRTAVPSIEVPYGTVYEHTPSTLLSSDSTLYAGPFVLSGDSLRYKYDGGSVLIPLNGSPVKPTFYALDHLGSVRLVVSADGQVIERNYYYPSGCMITGNITNEGNIQPYKYNGKELDPMHGLYTYDYGARQYDPATMLWDRMDPLGEDSPEVSPYVYCLSNPVNRIDPDGRKVKPDEKSYAIILNTLSDAEKKYVVLTDGNIIDNDIMSQCNSQSNNFLALQMLVESQYIINVTSLSETQYVKNGEMFSEYFSPVEVNAEFKDINFTSSVGNTTGECGNLGVTYMPTNDGKGKSPIGNNSIHIYWCPLKV